MNVSPGDAELILTDTIVSPLVTPLGQSYGQSGAEETVSVSIKTVPPYLHELILEGLLHLHNVVFTVCSQHSALLLPVAEVERC